jgi:hypothetical protein
MAKNEVCEMCGSREADWVDPETGRLVDHPHLTPTGIRCHGCSEIANYKASVYGEGVPDGVRIVLWEDSDIDPTGRIKSKMKNRPSSDT